MKQVAKYNVENEHVEIHIERLLKILTRISIPSLDGCFDLLKQWFMTSQRTNKSIDVDMTESGSYRIVDSRNGRQNIIQGTYQELVDNEYIKMTIGMPELSDQEDVIEVEFEERENGGTQMFFFYQSLVERERRLTTLEYKQKKKEYHDSTVHGLELMFDKMHQILEQYVEDNNLLK